MNFTSHPAAHDTHLHTQRHRKSTGRKELAATGSYLRNLKVNDFSISSNPGLISVTVTDGVNNMICMPQTCVLVQTLQSFFFFTAICYFVFFS